MLHGYFRSDLLCVSTRLLPLTFPCFPLGQTSGFSRYAGAKVSQHNNQLPHYSGIVPNICTERQKLLNNRHHHSISKLLKVLISTLSIIVGFLLLVPPLILNFRPSLPTQIQLIYTPACSPQDIAYSSASPIFHSNASSSLLICSVFHDSAVSLTELLRFRRAPKSNMQYSAPDGDRFFYWKRLKDAV